MWRPRRNTTPKSIENLLGLILQAQWAELGEYLEEGGRARGQLSPDARIPRPFSSSDCVPSFPTVSVPPFYSTDCSPPLLSCLPPQPCFCRTSCSVPSCVSVITDEISHQCTGFPHPHELNSVPGHVGHCREILPSKSSNSKNIPVAWAGGLPIMPC